ncbi:actin family [Ephemerocybe angulata]|uniref:Actin family n=1 Tax=Ephemerocybe angulata TaxID=980116 RepID=A0A8H6H798_9AGAR|nr:actin family [Tulosesus angulatus]
MDWLENAAVVIENGSSQCKAGFAGEDGPRTVFPAKGFAYGALAFSHPVENGIVKNWEDMERVWDHVFREIRASPEEHPVLLTESPLNPKAEREKAAQVMFETYNIPGFYLIPSPQLSLHFPSVTAVVCELGDTVTHAAPAYEGYSIKHPIQRTEVGGRDVTIHLSNCFAERGYLFTTTSDLDAVQGIKEKHCYIEADDSSYISPSAGETTYQLPDGQDVILGNERSRAPEVLFQPSIAGKDEAGLHEAIYGAINKCDPELRHVLYRNIVLTGDTALLPGLVQRVQREIAALAPDGMKVKVRPPPFGKYSTWIGGSILASLSTFQDLWVTKQDYGEGGAEVVNRKCF